MPLAPDMQRRRSQMVARQIQERGITDERILRAMRDVPRHRFVPRGLVDHAYDDRALPIEEGQTISQPYVVARMIDALGIRPTDRVLEVGAGSGYATALLARLAREVFAIERHAALATRAGERLAELQAENVHVRCGDGTQGWPEHAPFDAILVSAGGAQVPRRLREQLAIGGRLLMPVGPDARSQQLVRVRRLDDQQYERELLERVSFVPLVGDDGE